MPDYTSLLKRLDAQAWGTLAMAGILFLVAIACYLWHRRLLKKEASDSLLSTAKKACCVARDEAAVKAVSVVDQPGLGFRAALVDHTELDGFTVKQLRAKAKEIGLKGVTGLRKADLLAAIKRVL